MSRVIKFRAWDHRSFKWFDMSYFRLMNGGIEVNEPGLGPVYVTQSYSLEQYTGLHDRDGVEIYEGDIVRKWSTDYSGTPRPINKLIRVEWRERKSFVGFNIGSGRPEHNEVIGNIHENPELLSGGVGDEA